MKKTFKIIFDKAKTFCRDETDLTHIVNALEMAMKLISSEGGNERIIIPAIIMHDVGWHHFSHDEELKTRGPALKNVELNHKHEIESAALADNILSELDYPQKEKEEIVRIISGHDNRSKPISKEDMIVKDADRLSRYTPECFEAFRLKFKYNEKEYFDLLKSKIERWLFTDSARSLAREFLLKRRLGIPAVEFTDGIHVDLYKILIGLEGEVVKAVKESIEKIVIKTVKEKVYDTKKMIEIYLADRKCIDVEELQRDEEFWSIAVQKIGKGGYIWIIDRENGCVIFHPNRKITNLPLEELKEKERVPEYLYGFWDWYDRALKGEESFSYYQGKNEKDEIIDKFQYVVPLNLKNAKWSINAAVPYDEFFKSIDILNKEIVQSVSDIADQAGYLADQVEQRTHELAESNKGLQKEIADRKKVERALRDSENKYRTLLENIPQKVFLKDRNSVYVSCNKNYAAGINIEPEEIAGMTDFDLFSEELAAKYKFDDSKVMESAQLKEIEEKYVQDGKERIVHTIKTPVRDEHDNIVGVLGIFWDITECKKTEKELKKTHEKLLVASRMAGMAEVATDVLHNVGNVLNSINVSTSLIQEKVLNSKSSSLLKVTEMLTEHANDMKTFITEDQQGKHIPVFIIEAAKLIADEQAYVIDKLKLLTDSVEHIKQIINTQQAYARAGGVEVLTDIKDVINNAIEINSAGLKRHGIKIKLELDELPDVHIDRHRVLQILVNLLSNGKYALSKCQNQEKLLTIRCYKHGKNRVRIEVIDNGVGIPRENLTKIFRHGFTTKQNGHGFGLHSSALAAKEIKGSLTAQSDGPGHGATFTLELPLHLKEIKGYKQ